MLKNGLDMSDFDEELVNLEDSVIYQTESLITKKGKKNKQVKIGGSRTGKIISRFFIILLTFLVLVTGAGCVFLFMQNEKLKNEKKDDAVQAIAEPSQGTYSEADVETLLAQAADEAAADAKSDLLRQIHDYVDADGALVMLRKIFAEEFLIISADGKYNFIPVIDNIARHEVDPEKLIQQENGDFVYMDGEVPVSHKGVDVSRYQGNIKWDQVASDGIEYAIIRLGLRGYGSGKVVIDNNYEANMAGAKAAGLDVGVYFYSQAVTEQEALEEVNFIVENLQGYDIELPVVLDMEYVTGDEGRANALSQSERTKIAITFCDAIKEAGYEAMIYGNMRTFLMMLDLTQLEDYPKWFAYYNLPIYYPYQFEMLQYSESGKVNGIDAKCDLNIVIGDYPW